MTLIALLDADQLVHKYALKFDTNYPDILKMNLDADISKLLTDSKCTHYRIFVGSYSKTFRNDLDVNYKAEREKTPNKDIFRHHLIDCWGATQCIGYEVDDALAMEQTEETILLHDDKDMFQVAGKHMVIEKWRLGELLRPHEFRVITEPEGLLSVYMQSLIGDITDNVIGVKGVGKKGAFKILKDCHNERDLYNRCLGIYNDDDRFHMNMNMLWLWRKFGENFTSRQNIIEWRLNDARCESSLAG